MKGENCSCRLCSQHADFSFSDLVVVGYNWLLLLENL